MDGRCGEQHTTDQLFGKDIDWTDGVRIRYQEMRECSPNDDTT